MKNNVPGKIIKMKRFFCPCFAIAVLFLLADRSVPAAETADILCINVRLSTAGDGENAWPKRRDFMMQVVRDNPYDFIGGQEVVVNPDPELNQFAFMAEKLPGYGVIFRSREKSEERGEGMPIFYRKDRWEIDAADQGIFWLSDTPAEPGSITWAGQSGCPRIVTWGLFHRLGADAKRTGRSLYVYCTHFDHVGQSARQKASELILRRIADRKNKDTPVVLLGDFNSGEGSPQIRYLKGEAVQMDGETKTPPLTLLDTFRVLYPDETDVATFNSFKEHDPKRAKIDYIFVTPDVKTMKAEIIRTQNAQGRFPTDHYPIRAVVEF